MHRCYILHINSMYTQQSQVSWNRDEFDEQIRVLNEYNSHSILKYVPNTFDWDMNTQSSRYTGEKKDNCKATHFFIPANSRI